MILVFTSVVSARESKMASGGMPHAMHMEIETASCGPEPRKDRKMGSTILDCFSRIVNDKQHERLIGGVDLIRHMYEKKSVSFSLSTFNLKFLEFPQIDVDNAVCYFHARSPRVHNTWFSG